MSIEKTRTAGSIAYAMSISATSPSWKAVETATRVAEVVERPLEQLPRLATLEVDRELAGFEVVDQMVLMRGLLGRLG